MIAEIHNAIRTTEHDGLGLPQQKMSGILQRTTYEFEKSEKLSKIKAIRGLTPNKELKIQLSDSLKALLVSKTSLDCRFRAMDSSSLMIGSTDYQFLRIRNTDIYEGKSPQFRKIYIINTIESGTSLILFLPHRDGGQKVPPQLELSTMHDNIKNAINSFTQEASYP